MRDIPLDSSLIPSDDCDFQDNTSVRCHEILSNLSRSSSGGRLGSLKRTCQESTRIAFAKSAKHCKSILSLTAATQRNNYEKSGRRSLSASVRFRLLGKRMVANNVLIENLNEEEFVPLKTLPSTCGSDDGDTLKVSKENVMSTNKEVSCSLISVDKESTKKDEQVEQGSSISNDSNSRIAVPRRTSALCITTLGPTSLNALQEWPFSPMSSINSSSHNSLHEAIQELNSKVGLVHGKKHAHCTACSRGGKDNNNIKVLTNVNSSLPSSSSSSSPEHKNKPYSLKSLNFTNHRNSNLSSASLRERKSSPRHEKSKQQTSQQQKRLYAHTCSTRAKLVHGEVS